MSNVPNEQPLSADEQIKQMAESLKQIKVILEVPIPEWSQDKYNKAADLTGKIRMTVVAIMQQYDEMTTYSRQAYKLLKESNNAHKLPNKKHQQYAFYLQRKQRGKPQP